ncbi:UspA domain-containing protein [Alicyclobacillus hesperidum URH17-3-68]|uniref:Universal stress protein n=1 Tax=Alicyclobacillus hesperidum TaxID=89784 RepID=A0A1H2V299_9BACL|nr:universal stress protein [Alicyclobacillus hesperidum]EJY55753.1 UspA domain-containing protein [Alicyclobacillus hesperidum URH17-3-68]GLV13644.1 universal stress protein [Alicyclobacillus hesperidum]SDW62427.1 Nucleotide-binding universal stress protein, UspA family [Alicyclobacillus hesperidum]
MKKILLATDGSQGAFQAGDMVIQFLDAFPEASVIALYVTPPAYATAGIGIGFVAELPEDDLKKVVNNVKQRVEHQFAGYESRVRFRSAFGPPAVTICQMADQEAVDLIVLGSHGYGVVDRLLLGSVSSSVVHRSHVPTLVVK